MDGKVSDVNLKIGNMEKLTKTKFEGREAYRNVRTKNAREPNRISPIDYTNHKKEHQRMELRKQRDHYTQASPKESKKKA